MAGSESQIEEMQRQLESMAAREQLLIQALNEALEAADRRLLNEVRHVTVEHEVRRTVILNELQLLAGRIGAFPISETSAPTIEYNAPTAENTSQTCDEDEAAQQGETGGDWRKAAAKIGNELDFYVNRIGPRRNSATV